MRRACRPLLLGVEWRDMGRLGRLLRQSREGQNLDLAQVESATGISTQSAAALEREDYELFFDVADVRSHLRVYARFLGLDIKQILELYESARPATTEIVADELEPISVAPERKQDAVTSSLFRNLVWLLSATLILGILAVALLLLLTPR